MWLAPSRRQGMLIQVHGLTPDSKCKFVNFIIPYTFTFMRLPHLYQEFFANCIVIINDWGMG